eukprot:GHVR01166427.1.p2 GENE.GHVR01166427.1~~GHVR01166427.1.p2  ORF type:complete len:258 (-),score=78.84 GHVR01166427.1:110-883(-)
MDTQVRRRVDVEDELKRLNEQLQHNRNISSDALKELENCRDTDWNIVKRLETQRCEVMRVLEGLHRVREEKDTLANKHFNKDLDITNALLVHRSREEAALLFAECIDALEVELDRWRGAVNEITCEIKDKYNDREQLTEMERHIATAEKKHTVCVRDLCRRLEELIGRAPGSQAAEQHLHMLNKALTTALSKSNTIGTSETAVKIVRGECGEKDTLCVYNCRNCGYDMKLQRNGVYIVEGAYPTRDEIKDWLHNDKK